MTTEHANRSIGQTVTCNHRGESGQPHNTGTLVQVYTERCTYPLAIILTQTGSRLRVKVESVRLAD